MFRCVVGSSFVSGKLLCRPQQGTTMNENSDILSITEVALNLRCSKAHVYNAISGKITGVSQLPVIPMGRRKLVRRSSLESWKVANEMIAASMSVKFIQD
jgi:hypothetical protein